MKVSAGMCWYLQVFDILPGTMYRYFLNNTLSYLRINQCRYQIVTFTMQYLPERNCRYVPLCAGFLIYV
jgi:hypothetical protein